MSDVEAAWLAAFEKDKEGIVVISGTGSIAYGQKANGTFARAGGLGPKKAMKARAIGLGKNGCNGPDESKAYKKVSAISPHLLPKFS